MNILEFIVVVKMLQDPALHYYGCCITVAVIVRVKEKIGMSQSLKKAISSFFDPKNLAVHPNNLLQTPKITQSTSF